MLLKRQYHQDKLVRNEQGKVIEVKPGAVKGVIIKRADHGVQHFTQNFLDGGFKEGWLSMGQGRITIQTLEGDDLVYKIIRTPGYYCCHCDAELKDAGPSPSGSAAAMKHVNGGHKGMPSPDPNNRAGYRKDNFYTVFNEAAGVNNMSVEEATEMERKTRAALHGKLMGKYGPKEARQ